MRRAGRGFCRFWVDPPEADWAQDEMGRGATYKLFVKSRNEAGCAVLKLAGRWFCVVGQSMRL